MPKPLSKDLRQRVIAAVKAGASRREAARRFAIAPSTAIKWTSQWQREESLEPKPQGGNRRSQRIDAHAEEILALIRQKPDITLAEIVAHLQEHHDERFSISVVWRLLDRCGLSFKKNRTRS